MFGDESPSCSLDPKSGGVPRSRCQNLCEYYTSRVNFRHQEVLANLLNLLLICMLLTYILSIHAKTLNVMLLVKVKKPVFFV